VEPTIVAWVASEMRAEDVATMETALQTMRTNRERARSYQKAHFAFHNVALQRYPEAIREMVEAIYVNIERSQSRHFTRPHVAEDFIDIDGLLLEAFRTRNGEMARHILEFHLLDAGLGMIRDLDPDKVPQTLLVAARGIGIEVDAPAGRPLPRPTPMRWARGAGGNDLPPLRTGNLVYSPAP
jgi:DNA-binding GntR family transcriptional regulator